MLIFSDTDQLLLAKLINSKYIAFHSFVAHLFIADKGKNTWIYSFLIVC
jgi:hypothetical protein